ncbi:NTF2-related export protein-like [Drosophila grimshawi]|uniref:NTF2-related export protein-like n=1 Tax=Drosophila grimshawi TaxID=7222 RepID=UPI000C86E85B|nr:NTF2-related export protein-like [Drosophila grimshawi]
MSDDHPSELAFEAFIRIYYEHFDFQRFCFANLYHKMATLNFGSEPIHGSDEIQHQIMQMPRTLHRLTAVICESISLQEYTHKKLYHCKISGRVLFYNEERNFKQNFVILIGNDKWKIILDSYSLEQVYKQSE